MNKDKKYINILELLIESYLRGNNVIDRDVRITQIKKERTQSSLYKAFLKKFKACFSFLGIDNLNFLKENGKYKIACEDIDFFCRLMNDFTEPDSYMKKIKKKDITSANTEGKMIHATEEFLRVIKKYIDDVNLCKSIENAVKEKTEYDYLICATNIEYIRGYVDDIIEGTLYSSKNSTVNPYVFLNKTDRVFVFDELRNVLEEFKKSIDEKNTERRLELLEEFNEYVLRKEQNISKFLFYYDKYLQCKGIEGSYAYQLIKKNQTESKESLNNDGDQIESKEFSNDGDDQAKLIEFLNIGDNQKEDDFIKFCKTNGCSNIDEVKEQYEIYLSLCEDFKKERTIKWDDLK